MTAVGMIIYRRNACSDAQLVGQTAKAQKSKPRRATEQRTDASRSHEDAPGAVAPSWMIQFFTPVSAQFISSPGNGKRASTIFSPRNKNV
jgi:hypothetical protein